MLGGAAKAWHGAGAEPLRPSSGSKRREKLSSRQAPPLRGCPGAAPGGAEVAGAAALMDRPGGGGGKGRSARQPPPGASHAPTPRLEERKDTHRAGDIALK